MSDENLYEKVTTAIFKEDDEEETKEFPADFEAALADIYGEEEVEHAEEEKEEQEQKPGVLEDAQDDLSEKSEETKDTESEGLRSRLKDSLGVEIPEEENKALNEASSRVSENLYEGLEYEVHSINQEANRLQRLNQDVEALKNKAPMLNGKSVLGMSREQIDQLVNEAFEDGSIAQGLEVKTYLKELGDKWQELQVGAQELYQRNQSLEWKTLAEALNKQVPELRPHLGEIENYLSQRLTDPTLAQQASTVEGKKQLLGEAISRLGLVSKLSSTEKAESKKVVKNFEETEMSKDEKIVNKSVTNTGGKAKKITLSQARKVSQELLKMPPGPERYAKQDKWDAIFKEAVREGRFIDDTNM